MTRFLETLIGMPPQMRERQIAFFRDRLSSEPASPEAILWKASLAIYASKLEEAESLLHLALSSPDTDVQWGAHELLWSLEEYRNPEDPSLDHLEAWIALDPEAVMAKYELALVEYKRQ